jgi:ubiquitin-conjugating enzyme E2 variant
VLLVIGVVIIAGAWLTGMLTWQLVLFVAIGANANEIHKWNHVSRKRRPKLVVALQNARLLQTAKHHGKHHVGSKDTNYCVITNFMNPILDTVLFWHGLEWIVEHSLGVCTRSSLEKQVGSRQVSEGARKRLAER